MFQDSAWKTPALRRLARIFLSIDKEEDLLNFLRDLCTRDELVELSQRWKIAELLAAGHLYRSIAAKTKVSTTTVTRIAEWLEHGTGGYRATLKKINKQSKRQ